MNIKLNKKIIISKDKEPIIVAEISGNHCGKKSLFLKHIESAAKHGADMIKIQTYEPEDITPKEKDFNHVIKSGIWKSRSLWSLFREACTPYDWHADAFALAKKLKTVIFSTPFSVRAVDFLEKFKVPIYKIASFEITDLKLINYIAKKRKPIIISTGTANQIEIDKAVKTIKKYHSKIIILHCVSGYPTPESQANVNTILKLKNLYKGNLVGLSDHTNDINSSLASVSLGASLIEKHFKISDNLKSVDSDFSINPRQLLKLKNMSRSIFMSLGKISLKKKLDPNILKLRRSIFATRDIKKGAKINEKNITTLRPSVGIKSEDYFKILGKRVNKDIKKGHPIFQKQIK